jgi:hypothetical protein
MAAWLNGRVSDYDLFVSMSLLAFDGIKGCYLAQSHGSGDVEGWPAGVVLGPSRQMVWWIVL